MTARGACLCPKGGWPKGRHEASSGHHLSKASAVLSLRGGHRLRARKETAEAASTEFPERSQPCTVRPGTPCNRRAIDRVRPADRRNRMVLQELKRSAAARSADDWPAGR